MKLNINGKEIEVEDEQLSKALEEKQESLELKADFIIRTADEDKSFQENLRKEGLATGTEIGRKEVIKGLGIEGEGLHKSEATAVEAIKGFIQTKVSTELEEAKIEPNKKVAELTKDLETLKGTISEKDRLIQEKESQFSTFKKQHTLESTYAKNIPDNIALPRDQVLTLMKSSIKADVDENGNVYSLGADGQPKKDPTTLEVLPIKNEIENFFNTNPHLLKGAEGGAGEGDSGGNSGKQSQDDFVKEMREAGHEINGEKFVEIMQERLKAGTLEA